MSETRALPFDLTLTTPLPFSLSHETAQSSVMVIPDEAGVMVLPGAQLFPHSAMPMRIFEPRYREMLARCLESHRMFVLAHATSDPEGGVAPDLVAGLGLVSTCVTQADGTSQLLLQGLCRVRLDARRVDSGYWRARISPLEISAEGSAQEESRVLAILDHIDEHGVDGVEVPQDIRHMLRDLEDYHMLVDVIAGNLLHAPETRSRLMHESALLPRLELTLETLRRPRRKAA